MSLKRKIYLLDPKKINQETIAVTFAKTSRSPLSFIDIANELSDESSSQFHEKWVVGYGHSSVAEHAVLHIAVENISRLAVETLESNRLASYTEKSTRYQTWNQNAFFVPEELSNADYKNEYVDLINDLFHFYHKSITIIRSKLEEKYPLTSEETNSARDRKIQSSCIDVCRFILPSASLANVGVTINARELEHAIKKMLSHPLLEVKNIGKEIKNIAINEIPTLVKYADENSYLKNKKHEFSDTLDSNLNYQNRGTDWCQLINFDREAEENILAAILYRYGNNKIQDIKNQIRQLSSEKKDKLYEIIFNNLNTHDIPLRELEYSSYIFDLTLDQGAYFELKRHRMMSQTPQELNCSNGYAIPKLFNESNLSDEYIALMERVINLNKNLKSFNNEIASYIVPNAFNRNILIDLNYRSAFHFINLRTKPTAHFSIRRIAHRIAKDIQKSTPHLGKYLPTSSEETHQDIEKEHFFRTS